MFWPLLLVLVVVFALMVMLLRYLMRQNFTDAAMHLQELSADYARRQEEFKQRLQSSEREYEEQIARARAEADRLVAEARQEAESLRARRLEEARVESERIVQQGMESRDAIRKELERQLDGRAIQRACELIHDALPETLRRDIQRQWLEDLFRDGLSQLDQMNHEDGVQEVKVVSAFPLTKEQQEALRTRLAASLGRSLPLIEAVDPKLVAGLVITIGSLVFDGSLASRIQQTVRTTHTQAS